MKSITRFFLICTFLSGMFLTKVEGEENTFRVADSLMSAGAFRDAHLELEKIVFFNSSPQITTEALIRKSACYKQEGNFKKAYETLNRIFLVNQPDSFILTIRYEKALAFYLNKESGRAMVELQMLNKFLGDKEKAARIKFLSALSYCDLKKWDESKNEALGYLALVVSDSIKFKTNCDRVEELFLKKNIPRLLSKKTAKNLSMFIPGGGQFYTGRIGEGLLSFGLHGALLYFGASQFLDKFYFTGYTAGFGLLQRIYTGNLQRVQNLVEEVNKKRFDKFYMQYFNILSSAISE